jgi:hypothetical protein
MREGRICQQVGVFRKIVLRRGELREGGGVYIVDGSTPHPNDLNGVTKLICPHLTCPVSWVVERVFLIPLDDLFLTAGELVIGTEPDLELIVPLPPRAVLVGGDVKGERVEKGFREGFHRALYASRPERSPLK